MEYEDTLKYLYEQLPMFQRIGGAAYKAGLDTSINLAKLFDNPQERYKTIHVGGTNGKGSVSHLLATILQLNGYKVGLYTSPHLVDFRERIKVNGKMIPKENVIDFVNRFQSEKYGGHPSFFELTMMMAFDYFNIENVDVAIVEVGLGGRLDSTNIINPDMCVITNISFDHIQFLGNTLPLIASEKAGIIKPGVPVVIGEAEGDVRAVFEEKAIKTDSKIIFAEDTPEIIEQKRVKGFLQLNTVHFGAIKNQLSGDCQAKNANTVLHAVNELRELGYEISNESITKGFVSVCTLTGLMGRWMQIGEKPNTICDTGHNVGGISYIVNQLKNEKYERLHIIIGFVNDKDVSHIVEMLPHNAVYYFTQAQIPRALDSSEVKAIGDKNGLVGECYNTVAEAYNAAKIKASSHDMIFVGGSTFIVADLLSYINGQQ